MLEKKMNEILHFSSLCNDGERENFGQTEVQFESVLDSCMFYPQPRNSQNLFPQPQKFLNSRKRIFTKFYQPNL